MTLEGRHSRQMTQPSSIRINIRADWQLESGLVVYLGMCKTFQCCTGPHQIIGESTELCCCVVMVCSIRWTASQQGSVTHRLLTPAVAPLSDHFLQAQCTSTFCTQKEDISISADQIRTGHPSRCLLIPFPEASSSTALQCFSGRVPKDKSSRQHENLMIYEQHKDHENWAVIYRAINESTDWTGTPAVASWEFEGRHTACTKTIACLQLSADLIIVEPLGDLFCNGGRDQKFV